MTYPNNFLFKGFLKLRIRKKEIFALLFYHIFLLVNILLQKEAFRLTILFYR